MSRFYLLSAHCQYKLALKRIRSSWGESPCNKHYFSFWWLYSLKKGEWLKARESEWVVITVGILHVGVLRLCPQGVVNISKAVRSKYPSPQLYDQMSWKGFFNICEERCLKTFFCCNIRSQFDRLKFLCSALVILGCRMFAVGMSDSRPYNSLNYTQGNPH